MDVESLSVEEFHRGFVAAGVPVIITGMRNKVLKADWSLEHIVKVAGDCRNGLVGVFCSFYPDCCRPLQS